MAWQEEFLCCRSSRLRNERPSPLNADRERLISILHEPIQYLLNTINIRTCHQTLLNHLSKGKNDTILHMKTCHILRSS